MALTRTGQAHNRYNDRDYHFDTACSVSREAQQPVRHRYGATMQNYAAKKLVSTVSTNPNPNPLS